MNIDKKPTYTYTFALTEEEMKHFKFCIDYSWHRAMKHITPVSKYNQFLGILKTLCNDILK